MDGSGRITKRNRQFIKPISSYKSAIQHKLYAQTPQEPSHSTTTRSNHLINCAHTGPTADKAGRPSNNDAYTDAAGPKFIQQRLPDTDTQPEISMSDKTFNSGLKRAVQKVFKANTDNIQPEAAPKSSTKQLSDTDSAATSSTRNKRVKFATKPLIENV